MAYKLLISLLPVDIVNKVLEYNVCSDKLFRIHKEFNILIIKIIGANNKRKVYKKSINEIKKYNYANLIINSGVLIIAKHHINFSKETETKIHDYVKKNCKHCKGCGYDIQTNFVFFCTRCDYSMCKDSEIIKFFEYV